MSMKQHAFPWVGSDLGVVLHGDIVQKDESSCGKGVSQSRDSVTVNF